MSKRIINLALQGGGAFGALTWGVLDRWLDEPDIDIEGISGSSAGAMNAVALAHGWTEDGAAGAKRSLDAFWNAIGDLSFSVQMPFSNATDGSVAPGGNFLSAMTRVLSPYQWNPFDVNPLRSLVNKLFDFERLRSACPLKLFVGATAVHTGALRLFRNNELTAEHLLASACLPDIHHTITIDGESYWDGGYSGNPPIYPLLHECDADDVLAVLLIPLRRAETPTTLEGIRTRVREIHFNATFLREMRDLALQRRTAAESLLPGRLERRLRALKMHVIDAEELVSTLPLRKGMNTSSAFLQLLRDEGRARADAWLSQHRGAIGQRSTVDLEQLFGDAATR